MATYFKYDMYKNKEIQISTKKETLFVFIACIKRLHINIPKEIIIYILSNFICKYNIKYINYNTKMELYINTYFIDEKYICHMLMNEFSKYIYENKYIDQYLFVKSTRNQRKDTISHVVVSFSIVRRDEFAKMIEFISGVIDEHFNTKKHSINKINIKELTENHISLLHDLMEAIRYNNLDKTNPYVDFYKINSPVLYTIPKYYSSKPCIYIFTYGK